MNVSSIYILFKYMPASVVNCLLLPLGFNVTTGIESDDHEWFQYGDLSNTPLYMDAGIPGGHAIGDMYAFIAYNANSALWAVRALQMLLCLFIICIAFS